ncbi:hypothetical protein SEA_JUMBO_68 [Gordonia phage Jumbo]|uniref:Uncharacterized protein n=1 Tax=Gordonia phage Jumbo TaxID=1887650 RepID=A0A1B3B0T0_9CAUD|nr:hypothetical protein BIZ69_gp068 [Gordonia phage Jumbo]AOE44576.1 hypothetical protein SEA_JUMBO_68 [Gordonia phage Jumbo]
MRLGRAKKKPLDFNDILINDTIQNTVSGRVYRVVKNHGGPNGLGCIELTINPKYPDYEGVVIISSLDNFELYERATNAAYGRHCASSTTNRLTKRLKKMYEDWDKLDPENYGPGSHAK